MCVQQLIADWCAFFHVWSFLHSSFVFLCACRKKSTYSYRGTELPVYMASSVVFWHSKYRVTFQSRPYSDIRRF